MATASPAPDRDNGTGDGEKGDRPCPNRGRLPDWFVHCAMQWRGLSRRDQSAGPPALGFTWLWLPRPLQPDLRPAVGGDPHRRLRPPNFESTGALESTSQRMGAASIGRRRSCNGIADPRNSLNRVARTRFNNLQETFDPSSPFLYKRDR